MKKVLYVATVAEHFQYFYLPYFKIFNDKGWEVHAACQNPDPMKGCDRLFDIGINRSPLNSKNITAYRQLKKIIDEDDYDIIHCNTPMGGALTRIAAKKARKRGTKVIYTAHGFHFFMGAPAANWLIYYPIEWILSRLTDCLVTINDEDFIFAKKHFTVKKIVHIHGIGYNNKLFVRPSEEKKNELREKSGYNQKDILLAYVAELNANKNQALLIKTLKIISEGHKNVRLLLIGPDTLQGENQNLAKKLGLGAQIDFLGKRDDVENLLPMCDIAVASSKREGLPVNIMEALACGLPVVAADNRGHRALVKEGVNGFLTKQNDAEDMARRVIDILDDGEVYQRLSAQASDSVAVFGRDCVIKEMKALYEGV